MNIRDRIEGLEPREQRLLSILLGVFGVMVILIIPILVATMVSSHKDENDRLREAIDAIHGAGDQLATAELARKKTDQRYGKRAPALAGYLEKLADGNGIKIPESQDRASVPHGKKYEERSTKIVLRKVGMLSLAKFMESVENSGYPIRFSSMNLRRRSTEPDSYDVSLTVSAYDRKEETKKKSDESETAGDEGEEEEQED